LALSKRIWRGAGGRLKVKVWIPVALGSLIAIAYAFFYALSVSESQGVASFGLANSVGIFAVFVGLIAAGIILRRVAPPK
jgi:hypothetical protein